MLLNYPKDELKQILNEDINEEMMQNSVLNIDREQNNTQRQLKTLTYINIYKKSSSAFEQAYQTLIKVHDEGTYLQIINNEYNTKISYNNLSQCVKQFAQKVYKSYNINIYSMDNSNNVLKFQQFSHWIKTHKKLFNSFYSTFHRDIWTLNNTNSVEENIKIDLQFVGKIQYGKYKLQVYGYQIKDMIIFSESIKNRNKIIKIICLEGLVISKIGNLSIQISHRSQYYKNCVMIFKKVKQFQIWLDNLHKYQKQSLSINYIIQELIGTGKFSTVYKCKNKNTKKIYAIKTIQLNKLSKNALVAIRNQSQILKILNHPQILKYHQTIPTKIYTYIITQYIEGQDLFEYVRKRSYLNQFESAFIIGNIINATIYLHELGIMHRDLKPQNIMIIFKSKTQTEYFQCTNPNIRKGQRIANIKIIDFGISDHIKDLQKIEKSKLLAGTPNYIAPEIILGQNLTLKSDNFSIGSILYFMLKGTLPFAQLNSQKTLLNTVAGKYNLQSQHWDHVSQQAKDLISKLLAVDPNDRIQLQQAVNHEWFNCISNKARSKQWGRSVSDTNESIKKNMKQVDQIKTKTIQTMEICRKQKKTSTSLIKQKKLEKQRQSK